MANKKPQVIILLGPVGAGKSTVGRILQKELDGCFISIEEFFIEKFGNYENYSSHRDEAYQALAAEITAAIDRREWPLIFEEIAVSPQGKSLVDKMSLEYVTDLVCVEADLETCRLRVKHRGTEKNFSKSETVVENAWTAFSNIKRTFNFKAVILNQGISEQNLLEQIQKIWV